MGVDDTPRPGFNHWFSTGQLCLWLPHKAVHPELTQLADGSLSDPNRGEFVPAERHKGLCARVPAPRAREAHPAGPRLRLRAARAL